MSLALIVEFFTALPKLVNAVNALVEEVKQLKQDSINKSLETYKQEVSDTLAKISKATSDEERKKLSLELANRLKK